MNFKTSLAIAFLFFQLKSVSAQQQNVSPESFKDKANQLLQNAVSDNQCVGIAAGFSVNGITKWQGAAGFANLSTRQPFEPFTGTRLASVTKPFTAIAIMQLYEQNKIDLDKPLQEYLPAFPTKKEGVITIRHLLNHSSGIDDYKSNKEQENQKNYQDIETAVAIFKDRALIAAPGKAFNYTTYGYDVLGLVIEKVAGVSYEYYLQNFIFNKVGMANTGIEYPDKTYAGKAALYHRNSNGKLKEATPTNLSDRIPGGGIYSTVPDILKFGNAVLNNTLIKATTLQLMLQDPQLKKEGNGYGFGWYLYGVGKYGNVFGHNGTQTGASTFLMLLPEQHTSIIVLSNTSGAMQKVSAITIQLFDIAAESHEG
ncbi:serine hydrolase domain-containing protein [soil metagenome]